MKKVENAFVNQKQKMIFRGRKFDEREVNKMLIMKNEKLTQSHLGPI